MKLHANQHTHWMTRRDLFSTVIPGLILAREGFSQDQPDISERFRQISAKYEKEGLADPFKGITTNGNVEPGLFGVRATGVPTDAVRGAAERYLAVP